MAFCWSRLIECAFSLWEAHNAKLRADNAIAGERLDRMAKRREYIEKTRQPKRSA